MIHYDSLASAKHQITALTDEIAQKFEDNVQQQEEITQLIDMVVELQKKQKMVYMLLTISLSLMIFYDL